MIRTTTFTAATLAMVLVSGCATAQPSPAQIGSDGRTLKQGEFVGDAGPMPHEVTGRVQIVAYKDQTYVILSEDFTFDGAPDPYIGFGTRDRYNSDSTISPLNANDGGQVYRLPAKIDVDEYEDFFIWCQKFSVPLARADLR